MHNFFSLGLLMNYAFVMYLNLREYFMLCQPPSEMALKLSTPDAIAKTKSYNKAKLVVVFASLTVELVKDMVVINHRLLQLLYTSYFSAKVAYPELLFFLAYFNVKNVLDLPFNLISTFCVEARYGFNEMTLATFVGDFLKDAAITSAILAPAWIAISKIIAMFTTCTYVYLWLFVIAFQLFVVVVYPTLIQPLFNKFEELKDEDLKNDVKELADKVGLTAKKVLVMDASRRSRHANAYFIGLTKEKRVVLYDTLLEQVNKNEILAVLCHEFGHWKLNHTIKKMLFFFLVQLFYLLLFNSMLRNDLVQKTLFYENEPLVIKLLYFGYVIGMTQIPITLFINIFSRIHEREADRYAVDMGYGRELITGLIKLFNENNVNMDNDPIYSTVNHNHPTLLERIKLIEAELSKRE
jgi:STE24 endopeptidase